MADEISRMLEYAAGFYLKKVLIIALFSIPFFIAAIVPLLVPAPTYLAAGALFIRTGSLPEFSLPGIVFTIIAYAIVMFIISDTIVNINIIVRSKRTLNDTTQEMFSAMQTHALQIFVFLTLFEVLLFVVQILTFENSLQSIIYPLFAFVLSFLLFYVPPAVVIDNVGLVEAIGNSVRLAVRRPELILIWLLIAAVPLISVKFVADLLFAGIYAQYFVLLLNALVLLPFLIILQTQMYMEKYPLAR